MRPPVQDADRLDAEEPPVDPGDLLRKLLGIDGGKDGKGAAVDPFVKK